MVKQDDFVDEDLINENIAELSYEAFSKAKEKALKYNKSILLKINDGLYKVYKDGKKEFIKKIEPDIKVEKKTFEISL